MIKTIIFDIGQVLAKFRWKDYMDDLGFNQEIKERVGRATVLSPYWSEVDRGIMTMPEIIEACVKLDKEIEAEIRLFFKDRRTMVVEFDYAKDLVKGLKEQGYHIYLLSNYGEENFSYVENVFSFMPYIDGKIISYQIKHIKPESEIYQALIDTYHLIPDECVFLDDVEANLKGAEKFGIHTIHFTDLESAKKRLKELKIEI